MSASYKTNSQTVPSCRKIAIHVRIGHVHVAELAVTNMQHSYSAEKTVHTQTTRKLCKIKDTNVFSHEQNKRCNKETLPNLASICYNYLP